MNEADGKCVLLLDDEAAMTEMCRNFLSGFGYRAFEANDLGRARGLLRSESIQLVLCDLKLKDGESGLDLLQELLPRSPDVVVCVMTASQDMQLAIDCLRDGAFDFITKPFRLGDLRRSVERALRRRSKIIAEREEAEERMRALARFPEDNPNPVFRVDEEGAIRYSNEAGRTLLETWNLRRGERVHRSLVDLVAHRGTGTAAAAGRSSFAGDAMGKGECIPVEVAGGDRIFSFTATRIQGSSGFYLYGHDVTDWRRAERELLRLKNEATELSLRDQLTGLANRGFLESRFTDLSSRALADSCRLAFILLDLDNFKEINDVYGHETGDKVLVQAGRRLSQALGTEDILCRWGGDEIVILKTGCLDRDEVDRFCRALLTLGRDPLKAPGQTFPITLSIGYALFPDDGADLDGLMQRADQALYRAKEVGKDTCKGYHQLETKQVFRRSPELLVRFNRAVADDAIEVHYQPLIDAASGRVVAAEALARWTDSELGPIPPDHFIPEAEERGLIGRLGEGVLRKSLDALVRWREDGLELTLSVNLSRRQLLNDGFIGFLNDEVKRRGLPPSGLTLEVTERHSFFDTGIGRLRLDELVDCGYGLSLDDFGTGYSSLSEIASMPFGELKIAIGLTRQIVEDKGRKIVHAIALMGRGLGLTLVAEGVETEEEAAILREMGVHRLQGFLFARPMPVSDFINFAGGRRLTE